MYLGVDLGTSGLRAVLMDERGSIIASQESQYDVSHPHAGWSEQNPQNWIDACKICIDNLQTSHARELRTLRAIGLSGQMHGATLLNAAGEALRPCILWNDTRSSAQATRLDKTSGVRDLSGNIVFPGFTAPKLLWVEESEPEIFRQTATVLLPKDYLRYWLTGEFVSEMSDSAGTSWMDVGKRNWSPDLLDAGHMRADQMPRLVEGSEVSGQLRSDLAQDWGVSATVSVVGGGGDNAAAACGVGCFRDGDGFVSLGTSGVLLAAKETYTPAPETAVHSFCHAVPDTWYQMGVILAATDCLNWLSNNLGRTPAELSGLLNGPLSGPAKGLFLPYLSGERTPHNDSTVRGALVGLEISTDHSDLTQTVMEGVCFALRDNLAALRKTGTRLDRILAIGGGAQSRFWIETLATVLNLPIDLPEKGDFGAALGAARLAMAGVEDTNLSEIMTRPKVAETVNPREDLTDAYQEAYGKYRALYPNIKAALQ